MEKSPNLRLPEVTFEQVEGELRKRTFGILGTISREGRPHSTGVLYGVAPPSKPFELYIITATKNSKVRHISANPNVSFVVPLQRQFLTYFPPSCIQFQGTARIIEVNNETAVEAFNSSYLLRTTLNIESDIVARRNSEECFIRINPDPVIFTYGLGFSLWALRKHAAYAASRVEVPPERSRSR